MSVYAKKWLTFRNYDSVLFLFISIVMNIFFKSAIGLFLTLNGYGFSIVTPPVSFLFASLDSMLAIGIFFLIDKIPQRKMRLISHHLIIIGAIIFFYANYLIYQYFRTFINWGLICFNGAGSHELASYVLNDLNALILVLSFLAGGGICYLLRKKLITPFFRKQWLIFALLVLNLSIFLFLAQFGRAETGKMIRNPLIELLGSFTKEKLMMKEYTDISGFSAPGALIFGNSDRSSGGEGVLNHNKVQNILVIMVESLSLEMTSLRNPDEKSFKIIEKMKENSIIFDSYRTPFPGTSRSFISANCGTLPGTAQETITNYMPGFKCSSIAEKFNSAGYETGFFASLMFTYDNLSNSDFAGKYKVFKDFLSLKEKYGKGGKFYSYQVKDSDTASEAYDFMSKTVENGRNFFTFVFLYSTHYPYDSPLTTNELKGSVENYRKAQEYVSGVIEELVGKMEKRGFLDNTAVVITADHGEAFGKRTGVTGHGQSLHEEAIRIPLIISMPGLNKGIVSKRNGTHVDLAPTLAYIAGLDSNENWQGQNLLDDTTEEKPAFIFTRSATRLNGIIDGNYKYIHDITENTDTLFDLNSDPDELKNLSLEKPEKTEHYRTISKKWAVCQQKWITAKE